MLPEPQGKPFKPAFCWGGGCFFLKPCLPLFFCGGSDEVIFLRRLGHHRSVPFCSIGVTMPGERGRSRDRDKEKDRVDSAIVFARRDALGLLA